MGIIDLGIDTASPGRVERRALTDEKNVGQSALDALTKFIPAETIAMYTAVVAIISGWGTNDKASVNADLIVWFIVCGALSIALFFLSYLIQQRKEPKTVSQAVLAWRVCALIVSYAVWALAISSDTVNALSRLISNNPNAARAHDFIAILIIVVSPFLTLMDNYLATPKPALKPPPAGAQASP